jgi:NAD(P)-dependent dehydrogenase (short-subunit alcohol dehydrogenase family)
MGEATLEKLAAWIEGAQWVVATLRAEKDTHPDHDQRALALVATKLEEAELWLTRARA